MIYFPFGDCVELQQMLDQYQQQTCASPHLDEHAMAVDGLAIRINTPTHKEAENPINYVNRKGSSSIHTQAGSNSTLKVRFLSIIMAGSTHNSTAYLVTEDYSL